MRILIITQKVDKDDDLLGFFTSWVKAIAKRADEIYVICLAKGQYDLPQNVTVVSLGKERGRAKIWQALSFYYYAFKFLFKTDGVFVHMAPEYVRAMYPLNLFFHKPIVMWYAHIKVSSVAAWAIRHVNYILTPSKDSFAVDSSKVISTGHGINTVIFSPADVRPTKDVLALSRISRVKRIETLIEAIMILKNKGKKLTVDIYGSPARSEDTDYLDELKDKVRNYKLEAEINWMPAVSNPETPEVYADHKLFVRLQGGGGYGKTELEAMSMGIPAITPTTVYQNALGDFGPDLYFEEDNASELAERISQVLAWPKSRQDKYAKLARGLVVENHNVENVADKIVKLLQSCVA